MWGMVGSTRRSHQARCPHCWHVYNFVSKSAHKDSIHKFIHLGRAARSCSLLWIVKAGAGATRSWSREVWPS